MMIDHKCCTKKRAILVALFFVNYFMGDVLYLKTNCQHYIGTG